MPTSCSYSFSDLFCAAFHRPPTTLELKDLYALPQAERNRVVREWAAQAGWITEDVRGSDGIRYTSFGPAADAICRR